MSTSLRKCRVCGLEAHNEQELELFTKGERYLYGRMPLCKKCTNIKLHDRREKNKKQRIIIKPLYLRKCRICGYEAWFTEDLEKFLKNKGKPYDRQTICKKCSCKIRKPRRKENPKDTRFKKGHDTWNKGKTNLFKHTKEANEKRSKALIGRKRPEKIKKRISQTLMGHHVSKETLRKMAINRVLPSGENHYNWRGGISFEPYGLEFNSFIRKQIHIRDNHRCQICLKKSYLIHHIDYNKKNSLPNNLIALCKSCHGVVNHNREKWELYLKIVLGQLNVLRLLDSIEYSSNKER